ncbi:MAG: hypothetical protein AAGA93_15395 [Actinomycetota bacterium]
MLVAAVLAGGLRYATTDRTATDVSGVAAASTASEPTAGSAGLPAVDVERGSAPAGTGGGADDAPADEADGDTSAATDAARVGCAALDEELGRREELDLIDWDALEGRLDVGAVDEETIRLTLPPADGRVAAAGERPTIERFDDRYDPAEVSAEDLLEGIWRCEEAGFLLDPDDDADL